MAGVRRAAGGKDRGREYPVLDRVEHAAERNGRLPMSFAPRRKSPCPKKKMAERGGGLAHVLVKHEKPTMYWRE